MNGQHWTAQDNEILNVLGIAPVEPEQPQRSAWATERVLQAACAGAVQLHPQAGLFDAEIDIEIDGRPATEAEARALAELLTAGHVAWYSNTTAISCSETGRDLLTRWSKYRPCTLTNHRKGQH